MDLCDPIQMRPLTMPSACKALNVWIEQWRQQQDNPLFLQVSDMLRRFHEFQPDLDFISEPLLIKLCEYLQQAGILLLLPGSWVVLEPSVFSNRVIGKLFEPSALHNIHTNAVLDVDAIEDLTHGRLYFHDRSTMPTILEHLGLAIRHPFAPDEAPKYFPCFVQHEFTSEFHPTELAQGSRFIGRRFKLVDREHQVFVDGFFPRLFARLYNQLTPHGSRGSDIPQLFKHAIILKRDAPALRGEVDPPAMFLLVEHGTGHHTDSFDVISWCSERRGAAQEWLDGALALIQSYIRDSSNVVVSSRDLRLRRNLPVFQDRVQVAASSHHGHGDDESKEDELQHVMPDIGGYAASVESESESDACAQDKLLRKLDILEEKFELLHNDVKESRDAVRDIHTDKFSS